MPVPSAQPVLHEAECHDDDANDDFSYSCLRCEVHAAKAAIANVAQQARQAQRTLGAQRNQAKGGQGRRGVVVSEEEHRDGSQPAYLGQRRADKCCGRLDVTPTYGVANLGWMRASAGGDRPCTESRWLRRETAQETSLVVP